MINLDPAIIDQEGTRKKRRKKLLTYAILPVAILIVAGLFFMRPGMFNILYNANFDNEKAGFIIFLSQAQTKANIIEPYIAHYDTGTAYIKDRDGQKAEEELRKSLNSNPPSDKVCQVRTNLSYSIEMQADQEQIKHHYSEALILYSTAEGVLYGDNCASKQDSSKSRDKKADTAKERISQKRGRVTGQMNGKKGDDIDTPDATTDTQINEGQLKELRDNLMNGLDVQNYSRNNQYGSGSIPDVWHW